MFQLFKTMHLLALGLWLGAVVFFSFFIAIPLLVGMPGLITEKESWLRQEMKEPVYDKTTEDMIRADEDRRARQGRRLSGEALDIAFRTYFPFQAACAAAAVFTGLYLTRQGGFRAAGALLFASLALAGVFVNLFWLAKIVKRLRLDRYHPDPAIADPANAAFSAWHDYSLWTDMAGLACVFLAFVLAVGLKPKS